MQYCGLVGFCGELVGRPLQHSSHLILTCCLENGYKFGEINISNSNKCGFKTPNNWLLGYSLHHKNNLIFIREYNAVPSSGRRVVVATI